MNRLYLVLIIILACATNAYSQTTKRVISGLITSTDGSDPLEGVVVVVKGTNITSGSQQDGMYYIEVPANDSVLVFSRDEYQTREIRLSGSNEYNITLKPVHDTARAVGPFSANRAILSPLPAATTFFRKGSVI